MVGTLPAEIHEPFEERFGVTVVSAYSLTEDMTSVLNVMDKTRRKIGALGVPVSPETHQVRVVDEDDRDVPPGTGGEILKRSPASMLGYYKNPEATAAALRGGWVHTGDVGTLDADGFLYFLDRKKDIVRRSGENISSSEVEAVLHAHPGIAEAAVIPVPDPLREQEVMACIRLKEGQTPDTVRPEHVFSFCATRLAAYKIPRYLVYRDDFPRTASYKIQKEILKADAAALAARAVDRMHLPPK
jgi:acyl-CoA synthetase (AMP-forming)/AMP-acid ligase II